MFTLVPISFQGVLGLDGMLSPGIANNMGVGEAMAGMIKAGPVVGNVIVVMMILALLLAIIMAMDGSSRTLYPAQVDGWLPKYLARVNHAGAPTAAMWTDLGFNLILLSMSDYVFVPEFLWRRYVTDKGQFPGDMTEDLHLRPEPGVRTGAGYHSHLTVVADVVVIAISHWLAVLP